MRTCRPQAFPGQQDGDVVLGRVHWRQAVHGPLTELLDSAVGVLLGEYSLLLLKTAKKRSLSFGS